MVSKLFPAFSKNTANAIFSKTSCLYKYQRKRELSSLSIQPGSCHLAKTIIPFRQINIYGAKASKDKSQLMGFFRIIITPANIQTIIITPAIEETTPRGAL